MLLPVTSEQFNNADLNPQGSLYAEAFGKDESFLVEKDTNALIFDTQPQQFKDLVLLNRQSAMPAASDEFFWQEMPYQRTPIVAADASGAVVFPATQAITVSSLSGVSTNTEISYPDNTKGVVVAVDTTSLIITVQPLTDKTLPAVTAGDVINNLAPVEPDRMDGFAQQFRAETVEKNGFIQLMSKSIEYGRVERFKKSNTAVNNFLPMEQAAFFQQAKVDISNALWNGQQGEVVFPDGQAAKLTQGLFPAMVENGSPNAVTSAATLVDAFEEVCFASEFGEYGQVRFAFMTPEVHRVLSKAYKDEKTRYTPEDTFPIKNLDEVNIGSSRIVLVPYSRFKDRASFPASFKDRIYIIPMKNVKMRQMWSESSGENLTRKDGVPTTVLTQWLDFHAGFQFINLDAFAYLDITGL